MDEEPIRYHMTGAERWATSKEWPIDGTQYTDFYLGSLGQLSTKQDVFNPWPDTFLQDPLFISEERACVQYTTRPLSADMQVTGAPRITFFASLDQPDTNFRIQVRDADSDAIYPLAPGAG